MWQAWEAIWKRPSCKLRPVRSVLSEQLFPFQPKKDIPISFLERKGYSLFRNTRCFARHLWTEECTETWLPKCPIDVTAIGLTTLIDFANTCNIDPTQHWSYQIHRLLSAFMIRSRKPYQWHLYTNDKCLEILVCTWLFRLHCGTFKSKANSKYAYTYLRG